MNTAYTPLIAEAHTPPYKIHRYFARRPWNVFRRLIETYSDDNEIVLDPFCGGGVTIYEGIKLHRKMIGFDINPLSIFIIRNMIKKDISLECLDQAFNEVKEYITYLYNDYNRLIINTGKKGVPENKVKIDWNELAFNVYCKYCGKKVALTSENRIANGRYSCINDECRGSNKKGGYIEPKDCKRDGYIYLFSVASSPRSKEKTVIVYDKEKQDEVRKHIEFLNREIKKNKINIKKDKIPLNWDRQHEDLLHQKGIETFQDLFTERNLLINTLLLNYIKNLKIDKHVYEVLRLVFSSSLRDTNIMAFTNEDWQSGKPTTWAKHAYWIPSQFCEVDVLSSFEKAFNRVKASIIFNKQFDYNLRLAKNPKNIIDGSGNLFLNNLSIQDCHLPADSVDAIITDPPYGSNVQYLELSHFWYVWNKDMYGNKKPDFIKEAVCNRKKKFTGAKSMKDYENNLFNVFSEAHRVLKPNRYMVLTFNNKDMGAWVALLISIFKSGFEWEKDGLYFQDGVDNYKQTAHTKYEGSPYGDFIYVFKKVQPRCNHNREKVREEEFVKDIDSIFESYIDKFNSCKCDRNKIVRDMFTSVIPKMEQFVKSLDCDGSHNLYSHFTKNYLKEIYE